MSIRFITLLLVFTAACSFAQTKKKKTTTRNTSATAVTAQEAKVNALFEEMLSNTQQIFIIDSLVVDASEILKNIPLPQEQGVFANYVDVFEEQVDGASRVFINGFGNKCFYAINDTTHRARFYTRLNLDGTWTAPQEVTTLGEKLTRIDYPFMSEDGTKLFFAATSSDGLGGYDIYVTTYNAEDDEFLQAENLGLPFNSTADDLLYVEDETDGFGWLVSSRRQNGGNVCIYTFVPADVRQNYDMTTLGSAKVKSLAQITRIRDTWTTPEQRDEALVRLKKFKQRQNDSTDTEHVIYFVVDDNHVYTNPSQFLSSTDRQLFQTIVNSRQHLVDAQVELTQLRTQYQEANKSKQRTLKTSILRAEHELEAMQEKITEQEKRLRNNEIQLLNK